MLQREQLRGFQRAAAQFIKDTKRCALFIEMGLGKTVTVLTAVADLQRELELGRVLIVGPPRVARKVWPDEIRNWQHTKHMPFTLLLDGPQKRTRQLKAPTDIHLISHDLIPWLDQETCGEHDYDMIVIDESSGFKSQKSNRWKAMRRLAPRARYLVLMTGTPAANGMQDLWGQIYLIDQGARLGATESAFRSRYFDKATWGGEHAKDKAKKFSEHAIKNRIDDICFTLLEEDYSELPPRINNKIIVDLPPKIMEQYKAFVREYVLEVGETAINAVSAGALTQKLQQVANGRVLDADRNVHQIHEFKLDALDEVVGEIGGSPLMVGYSHRADIAAIQRRYPKAVLLGNNPRTIDAWNAGDIDMMIVHPKSGGHGLNLQFGGSNLVWYGLTWSLELYQQLNKRLHRKGQVNTTVIHHILARNTIDETIMEALLQKDQTQSAFMVALKRIIIDEYKKAA